MSSPVPARPNGQFSPTRATDYTHRTWLDDMADVLGIIAAAYRDLEVMDACADGVAAGRTQRDHIAGCHVEALDIMRSGVTFVDRTDTRYMAVYEAIEKAGGQAEVAQDKRYHDRD